MAYGTLVITLISAKGIKDVNFFTKMAVYARVFFSYKPSLWRRTLADRNGGRNPIWHSTFRYRFTRPGAFDGHFFCIFLRTEHILGDRDVGEVRVPLAKLLSRERGDDSRTISYQVRRMKSKKSEGILNFSYKFSQPAPAPAAYIPPPIVYPEASAPPYPDRAPPSSKADKPVMVHPVGASTAAYPADRAPPPPMVHPGASTAACPAESAPPPPMVHLVGASTSAVASTAAYPADRAPPPPMVQPQRKNNFGIGLRAGLVGGALGGFLQRQYCGGWTGILLLCLVLIVIKLRKSHPAS